MKDRLEKKESVIYVKEFDGKIVWFIDGGVPKSEVPYEAEIYTIYIDPKFQGNGIGKELMHTIMNDDFFKDKKSFYLWTLKEAPQSRGFYDKLWGKVFTEKYEEIGGKKYLMVGYYRQK
jgi:ribosomal protein S18 acetylase RimI-like enzyme